MTGNDLNSEMPFRHDSMLNRDGLDDWVAVWMLSSSKPW
jgi:hypothetical protein